MTKLVFLNELSNNLRLSQRQIRRLVKAGKFPAPVRISTRRSAWLPDDLTQWLEHRRGTDPAATIRAE